LKIPEKLSTKKVGVGNVERIVKRKIERHYTEKELSSSLQILAHYPL
jgi:hypothetical protein